MAKIDKIEAAARDSPQNIRFEDLVKLCDAYFESRSSNSGSHQTYKTPWRGDPRVNIQNKNGKAKPYQVRQVIAAIDKTKEENNGDT